MRVLVTAVRAGAEPQDVLVTADDSATAADIAAVLASTTGTSRPPGHQAPPGDVVPLSWSSKGHPDAQPTGPTLWADGRACHPTESAKSVLRDGMRVSVDDTVGPLMRAGEPSGDFEIRIVGGPAAGRVIRRSVGVTTIGSGGANGLVVPDPSLPDTAARVSIDMSGRVTLTPQPGTTVRLDEAKVTAESPWRLGAMLRIGDSMFVLDRPSPPDAHLSATGEGGLAYNRPPRLNAVRPRVRLHIPAPPSRGEGPRLELISAFIPSLFGVTMFFVTKQVYMLLFCLMSPMMVFGHYWSERRHGKKKFRKSVKQYKEELSQYESDLASACTQDQRARRTDLPDPAEVMLRAVGPRRTLWERRLTDPDALHLRVGMGDLPAEIELLQPGKQYDEDPPEPPTIHDVPVALPFATLGVVGVAGERGRALSTAHWLVAQAAVLHSPRDLSLVVLSSERDAGRSWSWSRWLPHCAPQLGQDCLALVGTDAETISRRVSELLTELDRRKAASSGQGMSITPLRPDPFVLLVLDGARLLRRVPGLPQLLQEGPRHGIYALCTDQDERLLPEECAAVVNWTPQSASHFFVRGGGLESVGSVLADHVTPEWCELISRSLAPVRDVSRDDADAALPTSARLLTLLGMPDPTGAHIADGWQRGGSTTVAPIGLAADGPFHLDIRKDGPHALVAGTTGAGKSELLQTIIASLAVANRPDALNFVLIDYKGGSAFQDCARLPHTVGMVSDLDAHLTERALASLAAELRRREEILFNAGTKDIEDYSDTRRLRPDLAPMPRLVLIIDEFASLVAELPDFIAGLVDIARRGRSLGVHLILATQRPAGVVSADIRANTNLRIALRVTDGAESSDVIDAPDAGTIAKSTPGRAYVRSGAQALVAVQSARIGGRRPSDGSSGPQADVSPIAWTSYSRPLPRSGDDEDDGTLVTDLAVLVDAIRGGAEALGFSTPRSPWLPPLPQEVTVDELAHLDVLSTSGGTSATAIPFGMTDLPSQQARTALAVDLVHGENTMIVGGPRSGRSTALRTLAGRLAQTSSPRDVHVYGIDCGANALLPLAGLPHCGAVVSRDQPERVRRLLDRLLVEISRRQQFLAAQGAASAAEQRESAPPEERLPLMVVFFDGWEGFVADFENYDYGRLMESANRIFREGGAVGLKVVMTADRTGFQGQVSSSFGSKHVLRLSDPNDFAVAGLNTRDVPHDMPPGRALSLTDGGVLESQVALLAADPSGRAQVEAFRAISAAAEPLGPDTPAALRPLRVDALPARISAAEAMALQPALVPPPLWALIGVGGDELRPVGIDLAESGPGFVIAGPPKSGRSSTLVTAARSLLARGTSLILVAPRKSPLRDLADEPLVAGLLNAESTEDDLEELIDTIDGPYVVVADDAELLYEAPLDEALETVIRKGMDGDHGLIAAGNSDTLSGQYRGFVVEARRSRNGLLLQPQSSTDGELFNIRIASNSGGGPVGSGLFAFGGGAMPIQAAQPE
ncbi:FtsK/SpoIIIE domain-containing protein [Streptomyces buecherae]|uniref:FtsK/SpoIIIE domain-containing protein n=1 Tax=Streptomyces buecherae TaxID=2763006 RepID=UPI001C274569|nr:FtsK/SpoIIIE domain-containing protein [Streptomyces buecherae]